MNSAIKRIYSHIAFYISVIFCFLPLPSLAQEYEKIPYGEGYILVPAQQKEPQPPSLNEQFQNYQAHHAFDVHPHQVNVQTQSSGRRCNDFPDVFCQLRKRMPLTFHEEWEIKLSWQYELIDQYRKEYPDYSSPHPTQADRNNPSLQKSIQFWECQQKLRQNLFALARGSSCERVEAFFEIAHRNVPSSNAGLYEKGVKKLIDKFCSYNRSEKKYRLNQVPWISYEESQAFFQEYLDLVPQDWRIVRYNLKSEYIEKICNSWQMVQKGYEVGGKHNAALIHMCKQDSAKSLYDYYTKSTMEHDPFITNFYKICISEKYSQAHQECSNAFSVQSDPLYTSNNQELLLLRKEYADKILSDFAPLQNLANQDIFTAIPQNISEILVALEDRNNFTKTIDSVLRNLEKNSPQVFLENGILCTLHNDPYVKYMRNENIDSELAHIINYGLIIQKHDAAPEGVKELAKKSVRLARLAINENHINHTNRMILAHTSYELLKHPKSSVLILHTMTDEARKIAHQSAIEKQEYVEKFYEERKKAFEKTEAEHYTQFARKYELHEDTVTLLCKEDLCPLDFENLHGTNLQHELMAETIEGLDTLAILNKHAQKYGNFGSSFQNTVSTLTLFAQAAQEFNSECEITASAHCINTLHSGLEIAVEGARGIGIGLENLSNIILHPIETGKSVLNFTKSIAWGLQETARYCLFDRTFNQNRARKTESQAEEFLEGVANHIAYSYSESSPGDYARIAAEQYTMLKAPGALLDAVSSAARLAKNASITAITESEIGLFLKNNMIDESYVQLASEISQEIKIGISELAETLIPNINDNSMKYKALLQSLITHQKIALSKIFSTLNLEADFIKIRTFINENLVAKLPKSLKVLLEKENVAFQDVKIKISHFFEASLGIKENKININGFHHDFGNYIESTKEFLFSNKTILQDDFYEALVSCNIPEYASMIATKQKTFFPANWSRLEVINFCLEHMSEAIIKHQDANAIIFTNKLKENLHIMYVYDKNKKWFSSIYPYIPERLKI